MSVPVIDGCAPIPGIISFDGGAKGVPVIDACGPKPPIRSFDDNRYVGAGASAVVFVSEPSASIDVGGGAGLNKLLKKFPMPPKKVPSTKLLPGPPPLSYGPVKPYCVPTGPLLRVKSDEYIGCDGPLCPPPEEVCAVLLTPVDGAAGVETGGMYTGFEKSDGIRKNEAEGVVSAGAINPPETPGIVGDAKSPALDACFAKAAAQVSARA